MSEFEFPSDKLIVQWHITEKCNLRCTHCYQTSYRHSGQKLGTLKTIAQQIVSLQKEITRQSGKEIALQLTLTGGEPFKHPDFLALLQHLALLSPKPSLAILSNGSPIDADMAQRLATFNPLFVQLSLDGTENTHNAIRGEGNFRKVLRATHFLKNAGIRVLWSFTAHSENWRDFEQIAELARQNHVDKLWSDRLIPENVETAPRTLTHKQCADYFVGMNKARQRAGQTQIAMNRALQFQTAGGRPYQCSAGHGLITIMPDGTVFPCRRLPVSVGNLFERDLSEIYFYSEFMQKLRAFSMPQDCQPCLYRFQCKGGLRCLSHAIYGDPFRRDPGCSLLR